MPSKACLQVWGLLTSLTALFLHCQLTHLHRKSTFQNISSTWQDYWDLWTMSVTTNLLTTNVDSQTLETPWRCSAVAERVLAFYARQAAPGRSNICRTWPFLPGSPFSYGSSLCKHTPTAQPSARRAEKTSRGQWGVAQLYDQQPTSWTDESELGSFARHTPLFSLQCSSPFSLPFCSCHLLPYVCLFVCLQIKCSTRLLKKLISCCGATQRYVITERIT